jgi:excinuclease ABC subunit C
MQKFSSEKSFEQAAELRDHLSSLSWLLKAPILPEEYIVNPNLDEDNRAHVLQDLTTILSPYIPILSLNRIETYDMSHLRGTSATGAMTVALNGSLTTSEYRHFHIKYSKTDSDVDMMKEVLSRRLSHTSWPTPGLIILDGGKSQLSLLATQLNFPCPVIGLAKRLETLVIPTQNDYIEINPPLTSPGFRLLMSLRDEAHRFSRQLHHKSRAKIFLK